MKVFSIGLLAAALSSGVLPDSCSKKDDCKWECDYKGDTGLLDLSQLGTDGGIRWKHLQAGAAFYEYSYNPCFPFSDPANSPGSAPSQECKNVVVCQNRKGATTDGYFNCGAQESEKVTVAGGALQIAYTGSSYKGGFRKSTVKVLCSEAETSLKANGDVSDGDYQFELRGKGACLVTVGLSGGSILLIIFFVSLFVYAIFGSLYLRWKRDAKGWEMIPNVNFWQALPSLIKEGGLFVYQNISRRLGYEKV